MAVTPLPAPFVTPPNWGQQLNDGIESRYQDSLTKITTEAGLRQAVSERVDTLETYEYAGVELASAEVMYSFFTGFAVSPATSAAIIGSQIIIPPTTGPVDLEFGCVAQVAVSGAGLLQLQVWKQEDFTVPYFTSQGVVTEQVTSFSGTQIEVAARRRLGPSAVQRIFFLAVQLFRDGGSGLTANVLNTPTSPSYLRAVGA